MHPRPLTVSRASATLWQHRPMLRIAAIAIPLIALPAWAALDDYQRARDALERKEVIPLAEILETVQGKIDARVIEVEFEELDGRYIYEFELITPDGRLMEAIADAVSGEILELREDIED
jgi:hypothetical protein